MNAMETYITPSVGSSNEYQVIAALPLTAAAVVVAKAVAAGVGAYVGYRVAKALFN